MKKLYLLLTIIFVGVITLNVHAEGEAWPKTFTHGDYTFTIEGIDLKVYSVDETLNTTITTTDDEGNTSTMTSNEDMNDYINGVPKTTIELDPTKYTITPEYRDEKFFETDTTFINLKLKIIKEGTPQSITKEDLETLLADQIADCTINKPYLVEIVVKYKLTNYPNKYTNFYNINMIREEYKLMYSVFNVPLTYNNTQTITDTVSQVMNVVMIGRESDAEPPTVTYEDTLNNESTSIDYILNYLILSEEEMTDNQQNKDASHLLLFHNVNNIDYLLSNSDNIDDVIESDAQEDLNFTTTPSSQMVQVPDTAKHQGLALFMVSLISILSGLLVIGYTIKMKEFRDARKNY